MKVGGLACIGYSLVLIVYAVFLLIDILGFVPFEIKYDGRGTKLTFLIKVFAFAVFTFFVGTIAFKTRKNFPNPPSSGQGG